MSIPSARSQLKAALAELMIRWDHVTEQWNDPVSEKFEKEYLLHLEPSVKKAVITPVRDRWTVKIGSGPDLKVQGNILDHEYKIEEGRTKIAEVSKKWFRFRDSYGVEVAPGQNDIIILAVTVAIDMMAHEGRTNV